MFTVRQLDQAVGRVAPLVRWQRYVAIDQLNTVALARAILAGAPHVERTFCLLVTTRAHLMGAPLMNMERAAHLIPRALNIGPNDVALVLTLATITNWEVDEHECRPTAMSGPAWYLQVTEHGLRFAGTVDYDTRPVVSVTAA